MSDKLKILCRKVGIAFGVGAGAVITVKSGPVIDDIENLDWPAAADAAYVLAGATVAGGLRALVALLTAWVPTDADTGKNLLGKYR